MYSDLKWYKKKKKRSQPISRY